jgi:hypothetical protein
MNLYVVFGTITLVVVLVTLFCAASYRAQVLVGADLAHARKAALNACCAQVVWLALTASAAALGVYADFDELPPKLPLTLLLALVLMLLFSRTKQYASFLHVAPLSWPIAVQSMRIVIEVGLWQLHRDGQLPKHLTFEGYNFDILVGLTAPVVALGVAQGWIGKRGAIAWNFCSIGFLVTIVFMAITSAPGPQHLPWPGVPNVMLAQFPTVWLPTFLVPVAVFSHATSLRQLFAVRNHNQALAPTNAMLL